VRCKKQCLKLLNLVPPFSRQKDDLSWPDFDLTGKSKRQKLVPFPRVGKRQALIPFPRTGKRSAPFISGARQGGGILIEQLLRAAQESLARVPEKEVEASETADEPRQLGWYLVLHVSHLVARRCVKMSKTNLPTCKMLKITCKMLKITITMSA
jgi:hypothetical protein